MTLNINKPKFMMQGKGSSISPLTVCLYVCLNLSNQRRQCLMSYQGASLCPCRCYFELPLSSCLSRPCCVGTFGTRNTVWFSAACTGRLWRSWVCSSRLLCLCWRDWTRSWKINSLSASPPTPAISTFLVLNQHKIGQRIHDGRQTNRYYR